MKLNIHKEAIINRLKEICLSVQIFDNDYRYNI